MLAGVVSNCTQLGQVLLGVASTFENTVYQRHMNNSGDSLYAPGCLLSVDSYLNTNVYVSSFLLFVKYKMNMYMPICPLKVCVWTKANAPTLIWTKKQRDSIVYIPHDKREGTTLM